MDETQKTVFSIVVTFLIFVLLVAGFYIVYRVEHRRARLAAASVPPAPPG